MLNLFLRAIVANVRMLNCNERYLDKSRSIDFGMLTKYSPQMLFCPGRKRHSGIFFVLSLLNKIQQMKVGIQWTYMPTIGSENQQIPLVMGRVTNKIWVKH